MTLNVQLAMQSSKSFPMMPENGAAAIALPNAH
jgi:hypothetical protein